MRNRVQSSIINAAIIVLSLLLVAFIYSFSTNRIYPGIPVSGSLPETDSKPLLAVEVYEENPILDMEVEVLNGCGETGIAAYLSDLLRDNQVDVVRSENADHFNYPLTLLIQRNERYETLKKVAASLNIDPGDKIHVLVQPDDALDVDVTVIIGKDFSSISSLSDFKMN